jgi:hypothetical protein
MRQRDPRWEFRRSEWRRSSRRRSLDCGCKIDHGERYNYFVGKPRTLYDGDPDPGLTQNLLCETHA